MFLGKFHAYRPFQFTLDSVAYQGKWNKIIRDEVNPPVRSVSRFQHIDHGLNTFLDIAFLSTTRKKGNGDMK